jgi:hypothetical protein
MKTLNLNACVPGHTRIAQLVTEQYKTEQVLLQSLLETTGKVSITLDCWISKNHHAFMAITAYHVMNDWKFHETLLDMKPVFGQHTGANLATHVLEVLTEFQLIN